jgi:hypothetical protein
MKLEGCQSRDKHLFVGTEKDDDKKKDGSSGGEENLDTVRHDYYQTATTIVASLFLKKITASESTIVFNEKSVTLDLKTQDKKRYKTEFPLFTSIKPQESKFRVLGTKLELTLAKADGQSWPVLRSDEKWTGERIQVGQAARV